MSIWVCNVLEAQIDQVVSELVLPVVRSAKQWLEEEVPHLNTQSKIAVLVVDSFPEEVVVGVARKCFHKPSTPTEGAKFAIEEVDLANNRKSRGLRFCDALEATEPRVVLVRNVHVPSREDLVAFVSSVQAASPNSAFLICTPKPAPHLLQNLIVGARLRLNITQFMCPNAEELYERLVYRILINNFLLPIRLHADCMEQLHEAWNISRSIADFKRFLSIVVHKHVLQEKCSFLCYTLMPQVAFEPQRDARPAVPAPEPRCPAEDICEPPDPGAALPISGASNSPLPGSNPISDPTNPTVHSQPPDAAANAAADPSACGAVLAEDGSEPAVSLTPPTVTPALLLLGPGSALQTPHQQSLLDSPTPSPALGSAMPQIWESPAKARRPLQSPSKDSGGEEQGFVEDSTDSVQLSLHASQASRDLLDADESNHSHGGASRPLADAAGQAATGPSSASSSNPQSQYFVSSGAAGDATQVQEECGPDATRSRFIEWANLRCPSVFLDYDHLEAFFAGRSTDLRSGCDEETVNRMREDWLGAGDQQQPKRKRDDDDAEEPHKASGKHPRLSSPRSCFRVLSDAAGDNQQHKACGAALTSPQQALDEKDLPHGWFVARTPEGKRYYYDVNGKAVWDRPVAESIKHEPRFPVNSAVVPLQMAQVLATLDTHLFKKAISGALFPPNFDGGREDMTRRLVQEGVLDELATLKSTTGPVKCYKSVRCVVCRLQQLFLRLFVMAVQFDLLYGIYYTVQPTAKILQDKFSGFYIKMLRDPRPLEETELMRHVPGMLEERVLNPDLCLRLLDCLIRVLQGIHVLPVEATVEARNMDGDWVAMGGDLQPILGDVVQLLRVARYKAELARLTEIRSELQQAPSSDAKKATQIAVKKLRGFLLSFKDFKEPSLADSLLSETVLLNAKSCTGLWWVECIENEEEQCTMTPHCVRNARFGLHQFSLYPATCSPHLELEHTNIFGLAAPNNALNQQLHPDALVWRLLCEQSNSTASPSALAEKFLALWPASSAPEQRKQLRQQFDRAIENLIFCDLLKVKNQTVMKA